MTMTTRRPWLALQGNAVLVLLALVDEYRIEGRATVRSVAERAGVPLSVTHQHLTTLRDRGFVLWAEGTQGTLRPQLDAVDEWVRGPRSSDEDGAA